MEPFGLIVVVPFKELSAQNLQEYKQTRDLNHPHFIETTSGAHLLSVSGGGTLGLWPGYRAAAPKDTALQLEV